MDRKDYREKIRKLLALAESPNEHEAKAALLRPGSSWRSISSQRGTVRMQRSRK